MAPGDLRGLAAPQHGRLVDLPGPGRLRRSRDDRPRGGGDGPGLRDGQVTSRSIDFLDRRDPERPFCLLVHHKAPHRPWIPDPRYEGRYTEGTIPEPETIADDHAGRSASVRRVAMRLDDLTLTDVKEPVPPELEGEERCAERSSWKYQRYMRDHLRCVQAVEDSVGELLDYLDEHDLAENTLVIYTSGQGFLLGDHGWFDKRPMFDESFTMPFVVRWPDGIPAGTRVEEMVTNVDVAATLLEAAGISPTALPEQQGRSFLPLLRGERVEDWPEAGYYRYWEHDDPEHHAPAYYGVRTRTHTYVHYYNDGPGTPGVAPLTCPCEGSTIAA
nr:sulfatase/phosphatase domain-containing protein [Brachybacterium sp. SGAir0954]